MRISDWSSDVCSSDLLLVEVTEAVAKEIGADRTGVRLSPISPASGTVISEDEQPLFNHVVDKLDALGIAYLHVVEGATGGPRDVAPFDFAALRNDRKSVL